MPTGNVRAKWGKLTDNEIEQTNGKREALTRRLQRHYGLTEEEAAGPPRLLLTDCLTGSRSVSNT